MGRIEGDFSKEIEKNIVQYTKKKNIDLGQFSLFIDAEEEGKDVATACHAVYNVL